MYQRPYADWTIKEFLFPKEFRMLESILYFRKIGQSMTEQIKGMLESTLFSTKRERL